jgi:ABC-type oligopeptide transport system substrate-binding subunit
MALGILGVLTVAACGGSSGGQSSGLAANQVLKFPVYQDPKTWDPGIADAEVDTELMQNAFDNLWRFDNNLNLAPDLATQVPSQSNGGLSSDGMTYTIHLRQNVTFSNGDKFSAKDVLYSWNRAVALNGPYRSNLSAIDGYSTVNKAGKAFCAKGADPTACHTAVEQKLLAKDPSLQMTGLTAPDGPDGFTVKVKLTSACGWCLAAWSLQGSTGAIVDEKVISNDPYLWWSKPAGQTDGQVGTGAYQLAEYIPKQSIKYKVVPNWWGTPKPTLKEVDMDIKDPSTQSTTITAWEQGSYDIVGYGGNSTLPVADLLRIKNNSSESSQLLLKPKGRTTYVSFNIGYPSTGGPFLGESPAAVGLRMAFALAVDKQGLASTVCHNIVCTAATGGIITKGLIGYLGDGQDPLGKFDPAKAKQLLQQYDPTGSKTANLTYDFNSGGLNDPTASYLQSQWQTNLGIHVNIQPHPDASAFISDRLSGKYVLSRDGWQFDYNHPQDWFDNLWGSLASGANTSGFADPTGDPGPDQQTYDSTLAKADAESTDKSLPLYNQLSKLLIKDVVYIPLYYSVGQFLIHSYVQGAGSTAQADYYWDGISIQNH